MPRLSSYRATALTPGANQALRLANCTTPLRAAMFLAQVGHESVDLLYTEEIASGAAYEGRLDLGNTEPGDGERFKGRSFIQITGRHNYGLFSRWAYDQGFANTPTYFVDHPDMLASDAWAWIGAVWYWTVARPTLNALADKGDLEGCTYLINGGYNGLADRRQRYVRCLDLNLVADGHNAPEEEEEVAKPYIVNAGNGNYWVVQVDLTSKTRVHTQATATALTNSDNYQKNPGFDVNTLAEIPEAKNR